MSSTIENIDIETDIDPERLIRETSHFFQDAKIQENASHAIGRKFQRRPQQTQMGLEVAHAFGQNQNLCIEAPTGVGKSLAYLVPAIHYALNHRRKVLITTETIHLQEQLIEKDIPLLQKIMGVQFTAVLAKGKRNYICKRRLRLATGNNREDYLPLKTSMIEVDKIARWSELTTKGSLSDINFSINSKLWDCICCENGNCLGNKCSYFRRCFYWLERRQWDKTDIVIANHALFFTDLKVKEIDKLDAGILPFYDALIIDEAHTLENNAAQHLGLRISRSGLLYFLYRIFDPNKGSGLLVRAGQEALEIRTLIANIIEQVRVFFDIIEDIFGDEKDNQFRIKIKLGTPDLLSKELGKLRSMLKEFEVLIQDQSIKSEIESQVQKCELFAQGVYDFLNMALEDHVYWIERNLAGHSTNVTLFTAPLNVSNILGKILFSGKKSVILTSATLAVGNNINYYNKRIGFARGASIMLSSPFNFQKQVEMHIPRIMPEPNEPEYQNELIEHIKKYILKTGGKAFVLFTNMELMKQCSYILKPFFMNNNIDLYTQGEDLSRSAMLERFRENTNSVIFGAASFWTGVDVPGEALSNVIITRLPFAVPSHPLIEARLEQIDKNENQNSFMTYLLPDAVLKFKQGVGRLIRSETDTGLIVILDRRVISKRYGGNFINSIPACPRIVE